ncbi:amino acid transporter [Anaeramoeba flamelloides]|uniref:Amino acid transporter n=1 Tax=Anaeramoeba flamelloides TaxID=1746091 RepID=A0ABQ8XWE9_9EUKA|nr:amino acid transporter [Anaeramoeba flamelloides]
MKQQKNKEPNYPRLHLIGASFTLCNTLLGGGTLSVPFGFYVSGIAQGLLLMFLCAIVSGYSLTLLDQMARLTGLNSYKDLSEFIFNKYFSKFVAMMFILLIFGSVTAYFCFIGDLSDSLISSLFEDSDWSGSNWIDRRLFISIITVMVIFPITFFRNIGSLRFPSYLVIVALFIVVLQTLIHSITNLSVNGLKATEISYFRFNSESLLAIPIFSLAFVCQMAFFPIRKELVHPTKHKVFLVITNTIFLGLAFYLVVGLFAYLDFKDKTKGDILLNYSTDSVWSILAQIGMIFAIIFSAPVIFFTGKTALRHLIYGSDSVENSKNLWFTSVIPFFLVLILSLIIPNVVSIFSITGAFCGTAIVMIFPPLFFIKLKYDLINKKHMKLNSKTNINLNHKSKYMDDQNDSTDLDISDENENDLQNNGINSNQKNKNFDRNIILSDSSNSDDRVQKNLIGFSENKFSENDDIHIESLQLIEEVNEIQMNITRKKLILPWVTMILGLICNVFCSIESIKEFTKKRN